VTEPHKYWEDKNGEMFDPSVIIEDWQAAQLNPIWEDHVETIKRSDLNDSIWILRRTGAVFDGIHRLTRAVLEGAGKIKVKYFDELPEEAVIK